MKKILFIILLGFLIGCKDNGPSPNNNGNGGAGTEYIIKGKLLNGTTMQPINPGLVMTLVVQNNGLQVKREELGSCKIQPDGSFEIKYTHSQLAEIITAKMRFESQFYISEYLPKNQNLDTILYESNEGQVLVVINTFNCSIEDTLYLGVPDIENFIRFDTLSLPKNGNYNIFRTKSGKSGVDYLLNDPIIKYYDWDSKSYSKAIGRASVKITGDPFTDTLYLVIKK